MLGVWRQVEQKSCGAFFSLKQVPAVDSERRLNSWELSDLFFSLGALRCVQTQLKVEFGCSIADKIDAMHKEGQRIQICPEVLQVFSCCTSWMWTKCKKVNRPKGKISKTTVYTQRKMSSNVNCRPPLQSINKPEKKKTRQGEFALRCVWMPRRPSSCAFPLPSTEHRSLSASFSFLFQLSDKTKPSVFFFFLSLCAGKQEPRHVHQRLEQLQPQHHVVVQLHR